ncbi:hypothetical protein [Jannaschia sp. M317]|uniref:hypothetical protein n=1 Tax=Jannaschia sp. M317 TaxID=2867011 RepID=UPI0021A6A925|nr:hypothetical protein [Jannaschia sp. M317]UWQ18957.1 hypothetical protein K3551_06670 [Jannaschia sp. M317]
MPETVNAFVDMIDAAFRGEVGAGILALNEAHVPELRTGGMSSGMVSGDFWRDTALPTLMDRFMRERDLRRVALLRKSVEGIHLLNPV